MTKLWNIITDAGQKKPYGMTDSLELAGKVPEGSVAVKCSDDLFLVKTEEGLRVYRTENSELEAAGSFPPATDADGFRTEISMAPDVILPAEFTEGMIKLGEDTIPVTVRKVREKMLLLDFEGQDAILFDTSRFLLYAFIDGEFFCGYVEV